MGGGRDWDAELQDLLKVNPNPDWAALGLEMFSGAWGTRIGGGGWSTAGAQTKVLLLKGLTLEQIEKGETDGGGATTERDWDAELAELLKDNPKPDWNALGFDNTSFGEGFVVGMMSWAATAKDKVLVMKGEKTVDQLKDESGN